MLHFLRAEITITALKLRAMRFDAILVYITAKHRSCGMETTG